jgi:hypothetical protein
MAIERERERRRAQPPSLPPTGPVLEPAQDASKLAHRASANADAVVAEPAGIEVAIRTTTSRTSDVVRMLATPDTPVADLMTEACASLELADRRRYVLVANMTEACASLELADRRRYVLVANGEVLADGGRPLGDLVREGQATALEMRLVRKPEAGAPAGR